MSQPDALCESLRNFGMLVGMKHRQTNDPLLFRVAEIMNHAEAEIRRLQAEVTTLQAQATTYWDALHDLATAKDMKDSGDQQEAYRALKDQAWRKARAALAKPAT